MNIRLTAKDTHTLTKVIDTEFIPVCPFCGNDDTLRKAYAKKYNESCGTVIVEEVQQ